MAFVRGGQLIKFLQTISKMRAERLRSFEETNQKIEKLTKIVYYSTFFSVISEMAECFITDNYCNNKELVNDPHYICGAQVPMWFPMEKSHTLFKLACTLYVSGFVVTQVPAIASSVSLYLGSVEFVIMKIEQFTRLLEQIDFLNDNKEEVGKKLRGAIEYFIGIDR